MSRTYTPTGLFREFWPQRHAAGAHGRFVRHVLLPSIIRELRKAPAGFVVADG